MLSYLLILSWLYLSEIKKDTNKKWCVLFFTHQTSNTCAGMCACDCTYQMEKTDKYHDFAVTVPRSYQDIYVNSFFP